MAYDIENVDVELAKYSAKTSTQLFWSPECGTNARGWKLLFGFWLF